VVQQEVLLGIVVAAIQSPLGAEARVHVTVGAELASVVAITAIGLASVRRRRMPGEEPGWVIPRRGVGRIGPVAVETLWPHMAALAGLRLGVRYRSVNLREVLSVRRGPLALGARALAPSRPSDRKDLHPGRLGQVTGEAALLGVTGGAGTGRLAGCSAVPGHEVWTLMIRWRLQLGPHRGRPWIRRECLDQRHLGSVHMALDAVVPCVASGAGRRNLPTGHLGELTVNAEGKARLPVRLRNREPAHICTRESGRLRQRDMTSGAAAVRRRQMGGLNSVTVETPLHDGQAHLHSPC